MSWIEISGEFGKSGKNAFFFPFNIKNKIKKFNKKNSKFLALGTVGILLYT